MLYETQLYWIVGIVGILIIYEKFDKIRKDKNSKNSAPNNKKMYSIDLTIDIDNKS